jgi:hypothetical protein
MTPSRVRVVSAQTEFAAALLDPGRGCPAGLRTWNGSDPAARLAVYRNNVVSSLIDALADTFPVVQQLVGEEFFRAMAALFVRQSPPRSKLLAQYGQDFPSFVDQFEPAQALPYLADVARLEAARVRACHAADAEPLSAESVGLALSLATHADRTGDLRLVCHPSVWPLVSRHAVVSLWAAHQVEGEIESVDVDAGECAIVLREGLDVLVLRVPDGTASFVAALQQGQNLGEAAATAATAAATVMTPASTFDLTATLSLLLGRGALTAIHLPQEASS